MKTICVVVTARASYAKIKPILTAIKNDPDLRLQLICAASAVIDRFGNVKQVIEDDGFTVDRVIPFLIEGETLLTSAKSTGLGMIEFATAFESLSPDCVVVMADRYEILACASAAAYMNIPLAHVQGGELSGNIDEKVRHSVTKLADIHFPATEEAKKVIEQMGEDPSRVHLVGCPSIDIARQVKSIKSPTFNLYAKYGGVGLRPCLANGYLIAMQHPVTLETSNASEDINKTLRAALEIKKPIIWFWPNPDAGSDEVSKAIRRFREKENPKNIHFIKNMEPYDFLEFLNLSDGIFGNSSCAIREASFLGIPAVNIGSRQSNREKGTNVLDVENDSVLITEAIQRHLRGRVEQSTLYGAGDAGESIKEVLKESKLEISKKFIRMESQRVE